MSTFWRLRKTDYYMTAIDLKKRIPELSKVDAEYITSRLRGSNMEFYKRETVKTPFYSRLTLIPALVLMLVLFIFMPVNYIISGKWGYKWIWLKNWLNSLGF